MSRQKINQDLPVTTHPSHNSLASARLASLKNNSSLDKKSLPKNREDVVFARNGKSDLSQVSQEFNNELGSKDKSLSVNFRSLGAPTKTDQRDKYPDIV